MLRILYLLIFAAFPLLYASDNGKILLAPTGGLTVSMRQNAMPPLGNSRVGEILTRYYNQGLGGLENWNKVESLSYSGKLKLEDRTFQLNAYHKKPNLIKINIRLETEQDPRVIAYDGNVVWEKNGTWTKPELVEEDEARRFIHNSHFGNYLLYPYAEGKRILLVDTVPAEGKICHQLRVELEKGYEIDYYIDIRSYLEVKAVHRDLKKGNTYSVVYKDYIKDQAIPIAGRSESYEDGKLANILLVDEVKINSGIMPWMFRMPKN